MNKKEDNIIEFRPKKNITFNRKKVRTYQETKKITHRLYLQTLRRPSILFINLIQPLLWLLMFGALFENAPIYLFENYKIEYREFLNPGILIFSAFNSSINAGLTIIFDREFGFLNRILISPISNKNSIIYSCISHTWLITMIQIIGITIITYYQNLTHHRISPTSLILSTLITSSIIISVSNMSIYSAFILPGHIEFIGLTTLFLNLPTLFTSTALAPLSFMPNWLQLICCINPLTYAIEMIRNIQLSNLSHLNQPLINNTLIELNQYNGIFILLTSNAITFILVKNIIKYKYDKT